MSKLAERDRALHGIDLLRDAAGTRGTAFTDEQRERLGLRGLLPPRVETLDEQRRRALGHYRNKDTDLGRYISLAALLDRNETLFYSLVHEHLEEMMPVIYTPTVGEACRRFGSIYRRPRGLYVSADDRGRVASLLANWPADDVRVIVATDGERILGLGDLGANGMGIAVGKLTLYSVCAGIDPACTLPIAIDTGTDSEAVRDDPHYLGLRRPRLRGEAYDELLDEFVDAANERWPGVLIQFEDFANRNAFRLLERYRDRVCTFNDDIQGTAAVALAGLMTASRHVGRSLADERVLFVGAGAAGLGIGELIAAELAIETGRTPEQARRACRFVDSKGLIVASRDDLTPGKRAFAHDGPPATTVLEAIRAVRPTAVIGVSGRGGALDEVSLRELARHEPRPIVFALSNPTAHAECTAEQAYRWTDGRAVFASGSPFAPVELDGRRFEPGQGNNAYVFPGVGLGVVAVRARRVTERMFAAAAATLAGLVTEEDLRVGRVYPALSRLREVSCAIAVAVAREALRSGLDGLPPAHRPADDAALGALVRSSVRDPGYVDG